MAENTFKEARVMGGLTQEQASRIIGTTLCTYQTLREATPGSFRLKELRNLYTQLDANAQSVLLNAISDFVCN